MSSFPQERNAVVGDDMSRDGMLRRSGNPSVLARASAIQQLC